MGTPIADKLPKPQPRIIGGPKGEPTSMDRAEKYEIGASGAAVVGLALGMVSAATASAVLMAVAAGFGATAAAGQLIARNMSSHDKKGDPGAHHDQTVPHPPTF